MPSYRVEFHSHCAGDPVDTYLTHTIYEHIDRAAEIGLHAMAITWHRKNCLVPDAIEYARQRNLLLVPGMETEVQRRHLVVLNLADGDLAPATSWEEIRALRQRRSDVLVMAPHPFYPHPSCLGRLIEGNADCIDAVEWCFLNVGWLPGTLNPNERAARWAARNGKPLLACSDAHSLDRIGRNASTVEADELTAPALFAGIRAGRVTFARDSFELGPLARQVGRVMIHFPKYLRCWAEAVWTERGSRR